MESHYEPIQEETSLETMAFPLMGLREWIPEEISLVQIEDSWMETSEQTPEEVFLALMEGQQEQIPRETF